MSRPRKHKFRSLEIGGEYVQENPPSWLKSAVYEYGRRYGKRFSVCKVTKRDPRSALVIRRTA